VYEPEPAYGTQSEVPPASTEPKSTTEPSARVTLTV
jgi:hypothetical protein